MTPRPAIRPAFDRSPSPGAPPSAPPSRQPSVYLALGYILVTYARLPEALSIITGHGFRLGVITTALAIVVLLLSGGFFRIFSSKIVLGLFAFTIWMGVSMPFSVWRGGSFSQFIYWILSLICLSLLAGCIDGLEHLRRAMFTMALSVLCIEAMSFFFGSMRADDGRLSFVTGTFANANDLAALLLIGLPFCLLAVRLLSDSLFFASPPFSASCSFPLPWSVRAHAADCWRW